MTATKEISIKNTKNEILNAYHQALKEIKEVKDTSAKEIQEIKKRKVVVNQASEESPNTVIESISQFKSMLSKSLDELSSQLICEQEKLANLQNAILIQEKSLKEIYDIQVELDSMDALILANKRSKQQLEDEINISKAKWQQEKDDYHRKLTEEKESLEKKRVREKDEYDYNLKKVRQSETDTYELKKGNLDRELTQRKENFEKEISEREHKVSEQESEFNRLKKEVDSFPNLLENSLKEAVDKVTQELNQRHEYLTNLTAKENEGKLALYKQTNQSLIEKITEQKALIDQLSERSNFASNQVQDIALKAIDGASKTRMNENILRKEATLSET